MDLGESIEGFGGSGFSSLLLSELESEDFLWIGTFFDELDEDDDEDFFFSAGGFFSESFELFDLEGSIGTTFGISLCSDFLDDELDEDFLLEGAFGESGFLSSSLSELDLSDFGGAIGSVGFIVGEDGATLLEELLDELLAFSCFLLELEDFEEIDFCFSGCLGELGFTGLDFFSDELEEELSGFLTSSS